MCRKYVRYGGPVIALVPGPTNFTKQFGVAVTLCSCVQECSYSNFNRDIAYIDCFCGSSWSLLAKSGLDCQFCDYDFLTHPIIIFIIIIIIIYYA